MALHGPVMPADVRTPRSPSSGQEELQPSVPGSSLRQAKLCRAIRLLLRDEHLEHLWSDGGPTAEASHARRALGRPLSARARPFLLAVFDIWDRKGCANFGEVIDGLTVEQLDKLFALAVANKMDHDRALDEWLMRYGG